MDRELKNCNGLINLVTKSLNKDFPNCSIRDIRIMDRTNGERTLKCTINNEVFYLGNLPYESRTTIFKLIN